MTGRLRGVRLYEGPAFWAWNAAATALLATLWWGAGRPLTDGNPLLRVMAVGALLVVASLLYGPTCLDLTLWSVSVYAMFFWGLTLVVGSPLAYGLWVAFVSPHVEVHLK